MPLLASPNRGYTDWQRVENWDTGQLWSYSFTNQLPGPQSPIIDVSRIAYIAGYVEATLNDCVLSPVWYLDAAGATMVAMRNIGLSASIVHPAQLRIPNLGPYLQVSINPAGAANASSDGVFFGTNRYHPLEFITRDPVLVEVNNANIAASGTNVYYFSGYYAGPFMLNFITTVSCYINPEYLDASDTWLSIGTMQSAANARTFQPLIAPAAAFRLRVVNTTAGAGVVTLSATPTVTGSS